MSFGNQASAILSGTIVPELDDEKVMRILVHYGWIDGRWNRLSRQRGILRLMCSLSPADRVLVNNWYRNGGDITDIAITNPPPAPPVLLTDKVYSIDDEDDDSDLGSLARDDRLRSILRMPAGPTNNLPLLNGQNVEALLPGLMSLAGITPAPGPDPFNWAGTPAGANTTAAAAANLPGANPSEASPSGANSLEVNSSGANLSGVGEQSGVAEQSGGGEQSGVAEQSGGEEQSGGGEQSGEETSFRGRVLCIRGAI